MPLDWLLADYRRLGTHRVYDYRHPSAEEAVTPDEAARRIASLLRSGATYGYDFRPHRP